MIFHKKRINIKLNNNDPVINIIWSFIFNNISFNLLTTIIVINIYLLLTFIYF